MPLVPPTAALTKRGRGKGAAHPQRIKAREKAAEALELRAKGLTYAAIAKEMQISTSGARKCVTRGLKLANAKGDARLAECQGVMIVQLDKLIAGLSQRMDALDTEVPDTVGLQMALGREMLRVLERKAKLVGADAPKQREIIGGNTGQIVQLFSLEVESNGRGTS